MNGLLARLYASLLAQQHGMGPQMRMGVNGTMLPTAQPVVKRTPSTGVRG